MSAFKALGSVATVCLLLAPGQAPAYPIPPQTIWELVRDSELVLVAKVEDVRQEKREEDTWGGAIARLAPVEVWKGTAHGP